MNISLPNGKFIKIAQIKPVDPSEIRRLKRYFGTDITTIGRPYEEEAGLYYSPLKTVLYSKKSTPVTVAHELAHATSPSSGVSDVLEGLKPYLVGAGLAGAYFLPKRREKLLSLGLALSGFLPEIAEEYRAETLANKAVRELKMRPKLKKYFKQESRRVIGHYIKEPLLVAGLALPYIYWSTRKK